MRILAVGGLIACFAVGITGCTRAPASDTRVVASQDGISASIPANTARETTILLAHDGQSTDKKSALELHDAEVRQVLLCRLNGKPCLAVLLEGRDDALRLYDITSDSPREFWRGIPKRLNAWKVQIGDIDGDGKDDIVVGVYKKARFHPVIANRPFIYGWDGRDVYPKWLGSRLSRPFTDFVLADSGPGVRLTAIEETEDGRNELAVYKWDGFGLVGEWRGGHARHLSGLEASGPPRKQVVHVKADGVRRSYTWKGHGLRMGVFGGAVNGNREPRVPDEPASPECPDEWRGVTKDG